MRFRSKFGLQGWWFGLMFLIFDLPWIFGSRMSTADKVLAISMGVCLLLAVLSKYFVHWDLDETFIRVHRFGSSTIVPYAEILRVAGHSYWRQRPTLLKVTYSRADDELKVKRLYVNPADVQGFVRTLQKFAPTTAVDL